MSEALIRWLADRQAVAFVLLLVSLVGVCAFRLIDGSQFMTGFIALGAGYFSACHFSTEKGNGPAQ